MWRGERRKQRDTTFHGVALHARRLSFGLACTLLTSLNSPGVRRSEVHFLRLPLRSLYYRKKAQ